MVNGFSQGHYDAQKKIWVVEGSDAHSWVQVFFPEIGWINFDPTPGYGGAGQIAPGLTQTPTPGATVVPETPTPAPGTTPGAKPTPTASANKGATPSQDDQGNPSGGNTSQNSLFATLLILLVSLVVLVSAIVYSRSRRAGKGPSISLVYRRLCRLAGLMGSPPANWQTPYEYTYSLSRRFPQASAGLRRLADLFVRERWASPHLAPHSQEKQELEQLWPRLRNAIMRERFTRK